MTDHFLARKEGLAYEGRDKGAQAVGEVQCLHVWTALWAPDLEDPHIDGSVEASDWESVDGSQREELWERSAVWHQNQSQSHQRHEEDERQLTVDVVEEKAA